MSPPDPPELPEPHGMGGPGAMGGRVGAGAWAPEPTDFQINQAVSTIYTAPNEQAAINAAADIFTPTRDTPDIVVNALEHRVAQLRTPVGWTGRLPPSLPWNFDAGRLIEAAYYGHNTAPYLASLPVATASSGIAAMRPGNLPRTQTRSARFQARPRSPPAPPQYPEWSPPANSMPGWINPFTLLTSGWINSGSSAGI